ncbi:MAG: hypothetical protein Ct9H90mP8_3240 [Pseudomonadota bacterium]|nr:MAG: hypothetical protein Ct9H90mP8_3240 [Pseudomonadota bacterium]
MRSSKSWILAEKCSPHRYSCWNMLKIPCRTPKQLYSPLITKGDLIDQETKIARSGLSDYFNSIEIISEKNVPAYQKIPEKHQIQPERFLMVGNSIRSDILPVLEMGGTAVYVPYEIDWAHEHDFKPRSSHHFMK